MFSALSENSEFFRDRINLFIMLAPCCRVDRCSGTTIRSMSESASVVKLLKKMGPNLLPEPQVGSRFMSGLMRVTRAASTGMSMISDDDPSKLSQFGAKNYLGHFPAGTSFRCAEHYR